MTRLFCFVCKRHVEIDAPAKEAEKRFRALGHDDRKVRALRRGPVGYFKSEQQLAKEHAEAAIKKEGNDGD